MKGCRLLCVTAILTVVGFAPAPLPKKERIVKRDDLEMMQGVWKMTYQESSGQAYDHNFWVLVKGDRWAFVHGNRPPAGSEGSGYYLALDQSASPRAMEWASDKNRTSGWVASYRIEGKKMTVIYTSGTLKNNLHQRPTDFNGSVPHKMIFEYVGKQ